MKSLFYLFPVPIFLLGAITVTLLALIIVPRKFFSKKRRGWMLLLIEAILLTFFTWYTIQPKEYPINYQQVSIDSMQYLSRLANQKDFYIGTAISTQTIQVDGVASYYNSVTPENALKWGKLIADDLKTYNFSQADALVEFGQQNNLRVRGHVLVWGRAADFFKSPDLRRLLKDVPQEAMPDTLAKLVKTNIEIVLQRYRGRIQQWDVVNEPLHVFDGGFDENLFYEHLGKDYISNAFRWAHEVDQNVQLFLNEQFNEYDSDKANSFIHLLKELVADGVPINGVGIQAHAMFSIPKIEPFKQFLKEISNLGLKIELTELDARLRLFNGADDPYQAQGKFYQDICTACLDNPACTGITVWGVSDATDWYNNIGVFDLHRPNASTPFDIDMNPKPAYFGLLEALKDPAE